MANKHNSRLTQQQQIEQEAREYCKPLIYDVSIADVEQAYIAGATKYAPVWKKIEGYEGSDGAILWCAYGNTQGKCYHVTGAGWYSIERSRYVKATHYMPLPELPNQPE